jgi:methylglutaconyl-CoA hydratase
MNKEYVKSEIIKGVAYIEFFHPAHNSLPMIMLNDLAKEIRKSGQNTEVNIIVLSSGGNRTFCAGASFNELAAIQSEEEGKTFFSGFAQIINAMRTCGKLVIGRIQGKAIGGGVGLVAACDYTIASKYASVRLSELAIGIGPFVIGPAVERKIGLSAFSNLALNPSEWQTASWAKEKGLYMECFDTIEQVDKYMDHFVEKLNNYSPMALAEMKQILWKNTGHWREILEERAALSGQLILTQHARDAIKAFLSV